MNIMEILIVILLAVIAHILWKMYKQKEEEKSEAFNKELDVQYEENRKEKFKDYPHLYGKIEGTWLDVFVHHTENGLPMINMAFLLYLGESTKIDFSEGSFKWDTLWDLTEELIEHLEKYHDGSSAEHLIAVCTYWQIAAESMGELIKESPNKIISESGRESSPIEGKELEKSPYTDIEKILSFFPKKSNHPEIEFSFRDENGKFPRESKGSEIVHKRITV